MKLDLSESEITIIVNALRATEKNSRLGFANTASKLVLTGRTAEIGEKAAHFESAMRELAALRSKLGDDRPVKTD